MRDNTPLRLTAGLVPFGATESVSSMKTTPGMLFGFKRPPEGALRLAGHLPMTPGPLVGRRVCPSRLWWRAMSVLPETDRRASQSGKGTDADVLEQRGWRRGSPTVSRVRSSCFLQPPTSSPMVGGVVVLPFRSLALAATRPVSRRQRLSPRVDLDRRHPAVTDDVALVTGMEPALKSDRRNGSSENRVGPRSRQ